MGNVDGQVDHWPAKLDDLVISVGVVDPDGNRAVYDEPTSWGSSWGSHIDVVAPTEITTAHSNSSTSNWVFYGTSCATPFVTGLVGQIKLFDEDASPSKVEAFVRASGERYPENWNQYVGFGIVKNDKALDLLIGEGVSAETKPASLQYWDNDHKVFTLVVPWPNEAGLPPGVWRFRRWKGEYSFVTDELESGEIAAIWVDPQNTNGSIKNPRAWHQLRYNYAAVGAKP